MPSYPTGIQTPAAGRQAGGPHPPSKKKKGKKKPPGTLPVLPGTIDPKTGEVVQIGDAWKDPKKPVKRHREIIRRQRILRAAGFNIVIDGTWGPRSQKAWNRYLKNRSIVETKNRNDPLDLSDPRATPAPPTVDKREQQRIRRQEQRRKAEAAAKRQIKERRAAVLTRAASLRRDPTLARNMTVRQIMEVLTDKEVDYHPEKNVNLTKALQFKLAAKGYKTKINGQLDLQTINALKKAEADALAQEQRQLAKFVVDRLYKTGMVKPGEKPWWSTYKIPTAEELVKMVQLGTFEASVLFPQLLKQAISPAAGWRAVQAQQLARIANTIQPVGPAATTYRLTGDPEAVPLWQYMVDIIGVQDFVPYGDYSTQSGVGEEWRRKALSARAHNKEVIVQNELRRKGTVGQAMALLSATGPKDFQNKMIVLAHKQEQHYKQIQLRMASQDSTWWGTAIEGMFWLGEEGRGAIVGGLVNPLSPGTAIGRQEQGKETIAEANPIVRFAFEVSVDPLNFIAPLRLSSAAAAISLAKFGRGASLGRYVIKGDGLSKSLIYQKGTWKKSNAFKALALGDPLGLANTRFAEQIAETGRRLAQTKDEAMSAVNKRLKTSHRLGWRKPTFTVAGVDYTVPKIGSKKVQDFLDTTEVEMAEMLRKSPMLAHVVETLKGRNGSLYANPHSRTKSQYGADLSAYLAETFRPLLVAHLALDTANNSFKAKTAHLAELGLDQAEIAAAVRVAKQEAQEEYIKILRGFGTFRAGGADPGLAEMTGRNLQEELAQKMSVLQEKVELVLFPAIQRELELHADRLFEAAKAKNAMMAQEVKAAAKPVTHGGEQDFLRYAEHGEGGYSFQAVKGGKAAVFRAPDGTVKGHALVGDSGSVRVFVAPEWRRKGVATQLYHTLSLHGVPVENLSGRGEITTEGAAFFAGRRAAATAHPLWNADGTWRGAADVIDGDLVKAIRSTFEQPIQIRNRRFGLVHTHEEMIRVVTRELSINIGRLDDYSARRIATGLLSDKDRAIGAAAHDAEEERLIKEITGAWEQRADGWYDTRETLSESRLYARHLDAFEKTSIFDEGKDEIDPFAVMGRAVAPDPKTMSELEYNLFIIGAEMADVWSLELAGTGFRTPGLTGTFRDHSTQVRAVMDRRVAALRMAEESAVPHLLWEQRALWRAFQYAQGRKTELAYKALMGSLSLWKFATLALRPAWAVRNFIDNVAKGFIAGVRDPRYYIAGPGQAAGKKIASVLEQDIAQLRQLITFFDNLFNTDVGTHFDTIINTIWEHSSHTLSRMFKMLNVEVPPEVLEMGLRQDVWDKSRFRFANIPDDDRLIEVGVDPSDFRKAPAKAGEETRFEKIKEGLWNIMGQHPENYMRRVIYRHEYTKALRELSEDASLNSVQVHLGAAERALKKVEETLFDYSKISVAEDNLKFFFPFIQFWRKNSVFWAKTFTTKPWVPLAVLHFDDDRREAHGDLPLWMERYFHADEIADALAVVPGLDEAFDVLGIGGGAMTDPISFTSMAPFYRAFKTAAYGDNQLLPGERAARVGMLGALIDGLNDFGLGMNPFLRKPLEATGVANYRSWQRVFPQTALAEATAKYFGAEGIANMVVSMERILEFKLPQLNDSNEIAANFDYWVQTVVAEQVVRGEQPDIAAAEQTVRDWFMVVNLWGYFGGVYWRRATPEDMYLAKLQDDIFKEEIDYDSLTNAQKKQLKVWGMRGMDRLTYDRYIGMMPSVEAYFRGDQETKNKIKREQPEIIRYVDGSFTGHPVGNKFVRYAQRYVDQELYFAAMEVADTLDVAPELRQVARDMFLSPELAAYWKKNATPTRLRERMIQAEMRDYFNTLNKGYFAIPEDDFEARDAYLNDHPELVRDWNKNKDIAESYAAIYGNAKASLRDSYFAIVEREGWEGDAADFLKQFSFMFEGTASEKKIEDGEWLPGGGKWSAARVADFREAKPHLTWFFDSFLPKVGEKEGFAWLNKSDTDAAKIIKSYMNKYPSSKRLAYLKVAPYLKIYFGLPPEKRGEWLRSGSEASKIVLAFFKKYGDEQSQHSKDYLSTKADLNYYFSLPKETRSTWLDSNDPRAVKVKEYFKKYGKQHQFERGFKKLIEKYPGLAHGTPEQARRMEFWRQYFVLTPDQRPLFVLNEAEKHGIFVYGEFGEQEMHDEEQEYMRRAVGLGLSKRQSAFLYVRPLLKFYRTLPKGEKPLFLRANPELQWYFDNFSQGSPTGNKKLDRLVEQYFSLPAESFARSQFLSKHPQVQDWFDKRSSPAERAMRSLLEQYFKLDGFMRGDFLLDHPEIQEWFDQRREEKRTEMDALRAFDRSDPRLRPFYESAEDLQRAAERMRAKLRQSAINALTPDGIETRRERRTAA